MPIPTRTVSMHRLPAIKVPLEWGSLASEAAVGGNLFGQRMDTTNAATSPGALLLLNTSIPVADADTDTDADADADAPMPMPLPLSMLLTWSYALLRRCAQARCCASTTLGRRLPRRSGKSCVTG